MNYLLIRMECILELSWSALSISRQTNLWLILNIYMYNVGCCEKLAFHNLPHYKLGKASLLLPIYAFNYCLAALFTVFVFSSSCSLIFKRVLLSTLFSCFLLIQDISARNLNLLPTLMVYHTIPCVPAGLYRKPQPVRTEEKRTQRFFSSLLFLLCFGHTVVDAVAPLSVQANI